VEKRTIITTPSSDVLISRGYTEKSDYPMVENQKDNTNIINNNNIIEEQEEKSCSPAPVAKTPNALIIERANGLYDYYVSKFPTGKKKHKRSVSIDRIKQELKKGTTEDVIKGAIDTYFADKKETMTNGEYQYLKTCENFF